MTTAARLCLIDLSGIFRRHWAASQHEEVSAAYERTLRDVTACTSGYQHVAICIDSPPYLRKEIDPNYKAHREKSPAQMIEQLRAVQQALEDDGHWVIGSPGYEADDVIATIADWAQKNGHDVMIWSTDKDLLQCVNDKVTVTSPATGAVMNPEAVKAKFGVAPWLIGDLLALTGDASDGVPGIKGVGNKTAAPWLNEHGGLDGVLQNIDKLPGRWRDVVRESGELLQRSWRLTQLCLDVPIKPEEIMQERERKQAVPEVHEPEPDLTEPAPQQVQAMVLREPQIVEAQWERRLEPTSPEGAWKLAHHLHKSRIFGDWPNPEAVLGVILTGRSYGLDAVASLRGFHNIKGKASPSAMLLIGLVKRNPICQYFRLVESDAEKATWETRRRDEPEPTRMTYSIKQAQLAGLSNGDNWKKRPDEMIRKTAGVQLARAVYPDLCAGLYAAEELE